ncbi:MAG: glycosyltransferase [Acidobacteria bacterium]|nr:glycosyltransferase [Acidobacteriota bacterium]
MKPSALILSPEPPYPLNGGGALRTASLLEYLARRCLVDLVLFAVDGASDPAEGLPQGLVRNLLKIPLPAHSRSLPARVARNGWRMVRGVPPLLDRFRARDEILRQWLPGRRYALGLIEHFWCAPYLDVIAPFCRRVLLDLHNVESVWHERAGAAERWPVSAGHQRFASASRRLEEQLLPRFAGLLVASPQDQALLPKSAGRAIVYPNSIPLEACPPPGPKQHALVFSGNLEYRPNQQAIHWFATQVWPVIRQEWPELRWRILGKNAHAIRGLVSQDPRIALTGPVENAVAELASAEIAIVPVLAGSGTRVKILEAWAASLPVVSTTLGAEGLDALPGEHILLADRPADFAASISELLGAPERRSRLGSAGRILLERRYTWEAAWGCLEREESLLG